MNQNDVALHHAHKDSCNAVSFLVVMEPQSQREVTPTSTERALVMENDSNADLVIWMTMRQDDEETAFRACEILYRRHGALLLGWCEKNMRTILGDTAGGFVDTTFMKALDHADSFGCPNGISREEQTKTRDWLAVRNSEEPSEGQP